MSSLHLEPRPHRRRVRRSRDVRADGRRAIEASFERGFRVGLADLRGVLRGLPLLVRCAVRVHDRREPGGAQVLGVDVIGSTGLAERWLVVVAASQRVVLLFSASGGLEAAGRLVPHPSAPITPGARWTRIEWADDLDAHDWY